MRPAAGNPSDRRRRRLRLEISRAACRLFCDRGVAATSGDRIAAAVGLSTRTIWRHFRSKESCAEPIVIEGVEWEMGALRSWPRHLSLEDHLAAEALRYGSATTGTGYGSASVGTGYGSTAPGTGYGSTAPGTGYGSTAPGTGYGSAADAVRRADALLAVEVVRLAGREPAIRTAWLMAYDHVEREMTTIIARRLGLPAGDLTARLHGAAVAAAFRIVNEGLGAGGPRGAVPETPADFADDVIRRLARAVREATAGAIGDAVAPEATKAEAEAAELT
ncbi:TetR/AcrR family transcriptional regulator [Streptomyces sp. SYP-A7185]|uniref:TetR/AcrR family transcriptional regulator n=1 Tax=Streptomyces sp. SYP-A7185 TaxID=3040076 RepID=UPI0038F61B00